MNIEENDWVKFRNSESYTVTKKVLEKRPDGKLVVGDHDGDPNTTVIEPSKVNEKVE